jgi:hypothetical protein
LGAFLVFSIGRFFALTRRAFFLAFVLAFFLAAVRFAGLRLRNRWTILRRAGILVPTSAFLAM